MTGKRIENIDIWANGFFVSCNWFVLTLVFDDLQNVARFYYQIGKEQTINGTQTFSQVVNGNENITGIAYDEWGESQDINKAGYAILATKLNLKLISEF